MKIDNHFLYDVGSNLDEDRTSLFKFCACQVGLSEVVIWDGADGYHGFSDQATKLDVVSTSNEDTYQTGLGAWNVLIYGLDPDFNEISEFVLLSGTVPVTTKQSFIRVYRAIVINGGNTGVNPISGANIGTINITRTGSVAMPEDLMARITIGKGQTLMGIYTVPAKKSLLITGVSASIGKGQAGTFSFKSRNAFSNGVFSTKYDLRMYQSVVNLQLVAGFLLPEKTDLVITCITDAVNTVTASIGGIIIKTEAI